MLRGDPASDPQHLTVLRSAGLVSERREGTRRWYRARPEGARELRVWLESFWDDGLARLVEAAEREEQADDHATDDR